VKGLARKFLFLCNRPHGTCTDVRFTAVQQAVSLSATSVKHVLAGIGTCLRNAACMRVLNLQAFAALLASDLLIKLLCQAGSMRKVPEVPED